MAHITLSQLTTVLQRIVSWATGKFAAKNTYSGKIEYTDMPVVVLASMGSELDGTSAQRPMSAGSTYYLPAGQGAGARIMFVDSNGTAVKISNPESNVIYCNAYTGLLYRWDASESDMVPVGGDVDGLRKVYVDNMDFSSLDTLYSGVYQVIDQTTQRIIGVLVASSDNRFGENPYFVTQWLFSNLLLSDEYSGSFNGYYTIGRAHIIHRFYNASNTSYSDIPLNTWSEWKVYGITLDEMSEIFNSKVSSISVNGNAQPKDANGNVDISVQVTDGKSAYEVAVDEGFVGDEAAWLASLKGQDGNSGVASADGIESVNNLDGGTTDTLSKVYVLGANQGKALKDLIGLLEARVDDIEDGGGVSAVVSGDTLVISSASSPSVSVDSVGNNSLSCKAGNTATTSFLIQGRRLAGNIAIAVSDSTNWSVSPASISPVGGNVSTTQVVITYHPAPGTAPETQQQCTITITCDGVTYGTISMNGTVAAAPSIILTPSTLALSTVENEPKTGTINVKGAALEGDITLAISGSGFSLSSATVAKADAESANGVDVTVTFDGSADGSATITASSTNATNVTAAVTGALVSRKSEGETFDVGGLRYTVLADTSQVSVKNNGSTDAVVVPSTVNDENGIGYTVKALEYQAFSGSAITSIVLPDTLTSVLGGTSGYAEYSRAFKNCGSLVSADLGGASVMYQEFFDGCTNLENVTLRSVTRIFSNAFRGCSKLKKLILPDTIQKLENAWIGGAIEELQIGTSTNCAITNVWFNKMTGLKKLICFKSTPPGWSGSYHQLQYGGGFARGFRNYQSGLTSDSANETFDTNGTGKLYVPAGSVSAYENASGKANPWSYIKGDPNLAGDSSGRIYEITDDILLS